MIIPRHELNLFKRINKWVLVFGRRKTGKTFFVKNFTDYDEYFFVKRDKTIFVESSEKNITYDTFKELFRVLLNNEKKVVVDEFHRLGSDFLDFLHFTDKKGKVVLVSSTFNLSSKLVRTQSPLLGLFAEFPLGLIRLDDAATVLKKTTKKELLELCIMLKEPLAIQYYKPGMTANELFSVVIRTSKYLVPALVGEVFTEEQRSLSAVYEGVLRAVSVGKHVSSGISSFLFSRKLIPKDDPSTVQPYLNNLKQFGLIKRVLITNKKAYHYVHTSPLIELYYYGDEKYNLSELEPDNAFVSRLIKEKLPKLVEIHVRNFLAVKHGLREAVVLTPDFEIDGVLLKFKKTEIALEVKWKKTISAEDVKKAEDNLAKVKAKRKILFIPDKKTLKHKPSNLEVIDASDLFS